MSLNKFKNLPGSVKILIRPMLYLSLTLHGLLLIMPIASEPEAKSSPKKKESVKITQLLSLPSPKPITVVPVPKPTTVVQQNQILATRPPIQTPPTRLNAIIDSPKPFPIVQQNFATPTPVASVTPTPTPIAVASPTPTPTPIAVASPTPTPASVASPTPTPTPTSVASPTPTPTPTQNELIAGVANFENAQKSCSGLCWQIEEIPFRRLSASSKEKFEAQGYIVDEQNIEDDTGRSVYKISKDGKTQYFNVLSTVNGGTVYLITERLLTREELAQKAAL